MGASDHSPELVRIIGRIPYLNGGLFERHEIEISSDINIQDKAFEDIFDFFDKYDWHLDDRPLRDDNEINPDVLGYIFEKFINQKQMGAYYTKEDITDYISKNTIVPFLFDRVKQKVSIAFDRDDGVWKILRDNPDRYIYDAVKKGVIDAEGNEIKVPEAIADGIEDVSKRQNWNRTADEQFGLPTETWREYAARRQRCLEIRRKMQSGEIYDINDLITYNLDISKFAEDVIFTSESSDLVKAFYHAVAGRIPERSNEKLEQGITVLDPTCGSGAFLFAALKILEPLLDKCLDRMEDFIEDESALRPDSVKFSSFRRVLEEIEKHPNRAYFVLKSIIVNNLFGVDIMPDAVEICKLRLFLTLVAQVDANTDKKNYGLEPLPDIDFNIRAGNTLVGFANEREVYQAFQGVTQARLAFDDRADDFKRKAEETARIYEHFRLQQIKEGGEIKPEDKANLQTKLRELSGELDKFIAHEYGIDEIKKPQQFAAFLVSHQPFHWYSEFFGIIASGGFDVIIGNPPYVEYKDVKKDYRVNDYKTENCGDLYAFVMEQSKNLLAKDGRFGMIVPISIVSTDGFDSLRELMLEGETSSWILNFAERPSKLFSGVEKRLTIWISGKFKDNFTFLSSYQRWLSDERENLFSLLQFTPFKNSNSLVNTAIPKISSSLEQSILDRITKQKSLNLYFIRASEYFLYYTRKLRYFVQFFNFVPNIKNSKGESIEPSELKTISFDSEINKNSAIAILNSNLFFWFFNVFSDVRNVNRREIELFRCSLNSIDTQVKKNLQKLSEKLNKDFDKNSRYQTNDYGKFGVLTIQIFQPRLSKPIIDEIDRVLAKHYGFTDEELDFIINYDIKYRMGRDGEN